MIVAAVPAADLVVAVGGELMLMIGDGLMLGESEAGLLLNTIAEVL